MEKPNEQRNRFVLIFTFARNFFMAFLLKLTAARRLFYSVALFLFFYGLFASFYQWTFLGFIILNILLALEVADKLIAKDELEVAREIQMSLMPERAPANHEFDISCYSEPAREVGGDYYDFICKKGRQDHTFVIIGDVKGKGMAAALYMVRVQALLQYLTEKLNNPSEILIALNRNIRKIMQKDYFISLAITRINSSGVLQFSRAGHMPLIHYHTASNKLDFLVPRGIAVGLENNGYFDQIIEEINIRPEPHDILIYYTDGLIETMNRMNQEYGESSLSRLIRNHATQSASEIQDAILTDIAKFRGTAKFRDDMTLIIIKKKS
jgi:sigma-B regulation protein RsbU (phosphoserine phosphatase)